MDKNKILIVDDDFNAPVRLKDCHKPQDIIVIDNSEDETILVNGIRYKPITKEAKKVPKYGSRLNGLMMGAMLLGGMDIMNFDSGTYTRKLDSDISIVEEYGLIQLKKSRLSKWERDAVVRIFERNYEKVK